MKVYCEKAELYWNIYVYIHRHTCVCVCAARAEREQARKLLFFIDSFYENTRSRARTGLLP